MAISKPDELLLATAFATEEYHSSAPLRPSTSFVWFAASACGGVTACTPVAAVEYTLASPSAPSCRSRGLVAASCAFGAFTASGTPFITLSIAPTYRVWAATGVGVAVGAGLGVSSWVSATPAPAAAAIATTIVVSATNIGLRLRRRAGR